LLRDHPHSFNIIAQNFCFEKLKNIFSEKSGKICGKIAEKSFCCIKEKMWYNWEKRH
jgi:hypothetical protein